MRSKKKRDHSPLAKAQSNGTTRFPLLHREDRGKHRGSFRSSEGKTREDRHRKKISRMDDRSSSYAATPSRDKDIKNERSVTFRPENRE